jgi:hypothetical protein
MLIGEATLILKDFGKNGLVDKKQYLPANKK